MGALAEWPWNYVALWTLLSCAALGWALMQRHALAVRYRGDGRFLREPWKLATFVIACAGITLIAPYTGDVS